MEVFAHVLKHDDLSGRKLIFREASTCALCFGPGWVKDFRSLETTAAPSKEHAIETGICADQNLLCKCFRQGSRWEGMSPFLAHVDHMFVECQREFKNMDVGNPKNTPAIRGWFWYVLIQPIYSEFGDCWLLALPNSIIKKNFTQLKQTIWGSYPNPTALRWQSEIVKLLQLSRKIPFRSTARTSPFIILLEIRMLTVFFDVKNHSTRTCSSYSVMYR